MITDLRRIGKGLRTLVLSAVVLLGVGTAHATTYSFSFTTADALNALATTDPLYLVNGYFAFFLQPDDARLPINTYSYGYMHAAKESGPDRWYTQTIVDPSNPPNYSTGNLGPGLWSQFSKLPAQTEVTLASRANGGPGGTNIFMNTPPYTYSDNGTIMPFYFGTTVAQLTSLMDEAGTFSFRLSLDGELTSPVRFRGFASAIGSFDDTTFEEGAKPERRLKFSLNLTPILTPTPEPGTLGVISVGLAALSIWRVRKRPRLKSDCRKIDKTN